MGILRLFLALSVVIWHMPHRLGSLLDANMAVLFFFMLSGFYMALTINEVYAPKGAGWRRVFYLSRALRLYPAYFVMLAVMVIWFGLTQTPSVFLNHPDVPLPAFLVLVALNVFMVGQDFFEMIVNLTNYGELNPVTRAVVQAMPPHFFETDWMLVGQAWSLGSELLFYAMAPFIVRSVRRILFCLGIGLAIRFGLILGCHGFASEVWGYNFFPATCCLFLMGSLAYHAYPKLRTHRFPAFFGAGITVVFAVFALVSIIRWQGVLLIDRSTGFETLRIWTAFTLFAASLPFLFCCWRKNRIDRWIGELSYPLYLVHGLVIGLVFGHIKSGQAGHEMIAVVISVALAALMFTFVDQPIDAWRHRRFADAGKPSPKPTRRPEWAILAAVVIVLFANTIRLDAFAQPVGPPPILVTVDGHYNIVRYDDRVFGVPQGVPITWGGPNYDQDKRLIIATSVAAVEAQISQLPANVANPAILVGVDGHYNIVRFDGRIFGVPQGLPITWGAPGYDQDPHLIIAATVAQVEALINPAPVAKPSPPILIGERRHYNLVRYEGRIFGVPQGIPITWGAAGYDQDPRLIIGPTEANVVARIDALPPPPVLVAIDGHYNIVRYGGRVFGIPQGVPITWGVPGYDQDKRLIIAKTVASVRQRVALLSSTNP